jgi:hypothetical protein
MSPAKHGQMIGSPRGSRDRHRSRTRLTSGVSKIKMYFSQSVAPSAQDFLGMAGQAAA